VAPEVLGEHFHQFSHFSGLPQSTYHFLKLIWLACVWIIWKEMNNRVFNNKALAPAQLTDKVIMISFQWLKANLINFVFSYHDWWRSPLSCIGLML
jgi:hypothetical protein